MFFSVRTYYHILVRTFYLKNTISYSNSAILISPTIHFSQMLQSLQLSMYLNKHIFKHYYMKNL